MGLLSTSFAYLFNWRCIQANEMPESPRRVGQRANQGLWRGVAASRGGESRNGGRGPVEHGWGRCALRGVPQCGSRLGGPREQTPGGEERPAACLSLRATARDQVVFHHSEHCLKQVHHAVSNEEHRAKAPVPSDVA